MTDNKGGYLPSQWVDNLYLNYPAGNDPAEKQSFFWFHDHRMHHTGANVYKGMVGLFPIYDPILDSGDETKGLGLPGVRVNNPDGSFDVKYDIPMALYDCRFENGTTPHQDYHNGCGEFHPEWWGKTYFRHFPDHGFVGDVFTINGTAYPKLDVYRRKYRFRFLGASVARDYELMLMRSVSGPVAAPGTQGQWQLPDGQQCMKWNQIASEGGLLPTPIVRDSCQIWPAKRREFIVDFTKYADGSPTKPGDVVYLVNVLEMPDGRKPNFNAPGAKLYYKVPMMKIVIGDNPPEPDNSRIPAALRPMPQIPANTASLAQRKFTLQRGSAPSGETQWLINGLEFSATAPLALPSRKSPGEVWTIENGGGGWTHPMHLHMEEHTVLSRKGSTNTHPDDTGKEDVIALDPAESVTLFRRFRTFNGNYVAHCHNLAHEDHNMMFGWSIVP
jgi:FtsP/CotA-like multicopper oxidase with cupredoxin domain